MMNEEPGISPAEWAYHELKGFFYDGIYGRLWCMNCKSEVFLLEGERDSCPNDECHNFAPGLPPGGRDIFANTEQFTENMRRDFNREHVEHPNAPPELRIGND